MIPFLNLHIRGRRNVRRNPYAQRPRLPRATFFVLVAASLWLAACSDLLGNNNWPGLTVIDDRLYMAYGPQVVALDRETCDQPAWTYPAEAGGKVAFYAPPTVIDEQIFIGDYGASGGLFSPAIQVTAYQLEDVARGTPGETWSSSEFFSGSIIASPLVLDGRLYIAADKKLQAFDVESHELLWTFDKPAHSLWAQPAHQDGVLYLPSLDRNIYAVDAETGELLWQKTFEGAIADTPVVDGNYLYVPNFDSRLYALDITKQGEVVWTVVAQDWVWAAPVLADGRLYFGDTAGFMYVVDAQSGAQIWQQELNGRIHASPVVHGESVYVVTEAAATADEDPDTIGGRVYALDRFEGTEQWQKDAPGPLYSTPVIWGDGLAVAMLSEEAILILYDLENGSRQCSYLPDA